MKRLIFILRILALTKNLKQIPGIFLFAFFLFAALPASAGINEWTSNGPEGESVDSVAISPDYANDSTVFAGTWDGGVYKSTNGGENWTPMNNGLTSIRVYSVAISPDYANDSTVFAGTSGGGICKSTDGGENWTPMNNGLGSTGVPSVAISPDYANDSTVFAGTWWAGVLKSTDGGQSWTPVNTGIFCVIVRSVAISPDYANDSTVFAGTDAGIYKTTDGGQSWTPVNTGLTSTDVNSVSIFPDYANDSTVFAGCSYGDPLPGGVYKSTNGGQTWTPVNCGTSSRSVSISPNYTNDFTVFASSYFADTGNEGVYKSPDSGLSWTLVNTGLTSTYVHSVAISPDYANDSTVFAGTAGGGVFSYTFVDTCSIVTVRLPNGGEVIPSGSRYPINWCTPPQAAKFDIFYSKNNGTTWKTIVKNVTGKSYSWSVLTPPNNKKKCLVKVIGYNASGVKVGEDRSNSTFTIEVVRVTSPNGGEWLISGQTWNIMWQTNGTKNPVTIVELYYTTGKGIWNLITTLTSNPGSYNWTVPTVTGTKTKCKVKVLLKNSSGGSLGKDISDTVFTIEP